MYEEKGKSGIKNNKERGGKKGRERIHRSEEYFTNNKLDESFFTRFHVCILCHIKLRERKKKEQDNRSCISSKFYLVGTLHESWVNPRKPKWGLRLYTNQRPHTCLYIILKCCRENPYPVNISI